MSQIENKMEINIVHPSLNVHGGAELICLEMIKIFRNNNYKVNLYTLDKPDFNYISRSYGDFVKADSHFYYTNQQISTKAPIVRILYLGYLYMKLLLLSQKNNSITINNFGGVLPIIADFSYIHSVPLFSMHINSKQNPYQIPHWGATSKLYFIIFFLLKSIFRLSNIITNSQYNAQIIQSLISKKSLLIHPPIKKQDREDNCLEKRQMILTVSRISRMKNLEIIPHIASLVKVESLFSILGGTQAHSTEVINKITELSDKKGIVNKIKIIRNPKRNMIDDAYSSASVYLSTQPTEAFGMAIVEAIMHDCVPLTPRMGGPWIDILEERQGWFGFGYSSALQAALIIKLLLSNEEMRKKISKRAKKKATLYESQVFQTKMIKLMHHSGLYIS